jgi:autotransporter-associated beta strand protein
MVRAKGKSVRTILALAAAGASLSLATQSAWASVFNWVGPTDGTGTWSTAAGWTVDGNANTGNLLPGLNDDVTLAGAAGNTIVDQNFTIKTLTLSGHGSGTTNTVTDALVNSNNAVLTINQGLSAELNHRNINVPIALGADVTFAFTGSFPTGRLNSTVTGAHSVTYTASGVDVIFSGNNTFSDFTIESGTADPNNSNGTPLGQGTVYLGGSTPATSAANTGLNFQSNLLSGWSSVDITARAGAGTRKIAFAFGGSATYNLPSDITLEKDLTIDRSGGGAATFSGQISGSGGLIKTGIAQVVMATTAKTYTGATNVTAGEFTIASTSSLANAAITITPTGKASAAMDGAGTLFFQPGNLITVAGATFDVSGTPTPFTGTLDASQLHFDLTNLSLADHELVDYTNGTLILPSTLNDLLTQGSKDMGFSLIDTGTQIWAALPEPASALLILGGLGMLGLRRRK